MAFNIVVFHGLIGFESHQKTTLVRARTYPGTCAVINLRPHGRRMIPVEARLLTAKGRLNGGTIMRVAVVSLQCHQEFHTYGGYPSFQNSDCRSASCLGATGSLRLGWRRAPRLCKRDRSRPGAGPTAQCCNADSPLPRQRGAHQIPHFNLGIFKPVDDRSRNGVQRGCP